MATEEFKLTVNNLFNDYIELRKNMKDSGYEQVSLSFQQYLDFYISYMQNDEPIFEDEEDELSEDDGE